MSENEMKGRMATLKQNYRGYNRVRLIEKHQYQWLCKILLSGKEIYLYEDEFEID